MTALLDLTGLTVAQFAFCGAAVFVAGMVRGFAGFALSALVVASLVAILPPIELIAVCWILEMSASFLMVKAGTVEADKKMVFGLAVGSTLGGPIGLYLTNSLPVETSKMLALIIIMVLAVLQLLKVRAQFLATTSGVYFSGFIAGVATGLASVGGMVVALYVLARDAKASVMRSSLVIYLFVTSFFSLLYLIGFGMMNSLAIARGFCFIPLCMAGVLVGKALFRPKFEAYYKPFCLSLLLLLAAWGLVRMAMT